jgi:hypothetical protein
MIDPTLSRCACVPFLNVFLVFENYSKISNPCHYWSGSGKREINIKLVYLRISVHFYHELKNCQRTTNLINLRNTGAP